MICYSCKKPVQVEDKVFRGDLCRSCGRALHCCRNCGFYDIRAHNQCREPQAEWVGDKESANFCDYFRPAESAAGPSGAGAQEDSRKKLEDLFRKKPG
ncbi:MAG: hypothetical protein A3F83_09255 [Candidatus Glassbacteria bacterium RIFCSPLOWO2_12_FULL_58_11]|uniref:Uncharacterized protein n=1 Tax=Candidatus Glassbacteria bacterium RIFCSPLOWO2_12_FULL_58_11 TaxID=1817867 RepID=A0A1F5Z2D3_9BACT|nr:MAG: hypothetical protein A3F83_09255 [Candidatus Glassbacteria bacterium RIFCSPLOWO2_12_FULL_58_11]